MDILELAREQEITLCGEILEAGRQFQMQQGFVQWTKDYPNTETVRQDVKDQKGYVIRVDGTVAGYLCLDFGGDPAYEEIVGAWHYDEPYAVIHRMALAPEFRGGGLVDRFFRLIEEFCLAKGVRYIRIDTDFANRRMQHVLDKNGFKPCGTVLFEGSDKPAYDKLLV